MRELFLIPLLLNVAYSQLFEGELPVSLQPPPPLLPSDQSISKNFNSPFVSNVQPSVLVSQQPLGPTGPLGPIGPVGPPSASVAHPTALFKAEQEAKLPQNLLNPFYKNPRIADQLAKSSWFTPGEALVTDRETEKISREKIFYMLKSAGLARRRRFALTFLRK